MSIHMSLSNLTPARSGFAQVGTIAKEQLVKLQFNRSMENTLGHTNKDFFNLTHAAKTENAAAKPAITFAQGLKNFFERGTTF